MKRKMIYETRRQIRRGNGGNRVSELERIDHENLSAKTYRELRSALLDGRFTPGQRLRISTLASLLGTSITPVREAIFRLVSEGALEIKAATAVYVPSNSAKRLEEAMTIRLHLEGEAAAAAATKISRRQYLELCAIQEDFIEAAAQSPEQAGVLNRQFHFRLLEISDMPMTTSIVENLWVTSGPFMRLFHTRVPVRDLASRDHKHFNLLVALEKRDPEAAREAIQADLKWGGALMIKWAKEMESAAPEVPEAE